MRLFQLTRESIAHLFHGLSHFNDAELHPSGARAARPYLPPATRSCHLPPEMIHPLKGKPEYYLRTDSFQVTGDGHGHQAFSLQPPEPGCQPPKAERPTPELPIAVPVTCHPYR